MNNDFKILLAGEGGQGIQTIGKILFKLLSKSAKHVSIIPQFGPEQRGTPSVVFIQISDKKINFPRFEKADAILVLRKRAYKHIKSFIGKDTNIIFDSSAISRKDVSEKNGKVFGIPVTKLTKEKFLGYAANIIALAIFAKHFLGVEQNQLWLETEEILKFKFLKNHESKVTSKKAVEFAYGYELETKNFSQAKYDTDNNIIFKNNSEKKVILIPSLCKSCGICIEKCPVSALGWGETIGVFGKPTPEVDLEKCIACGNCFRFCPDSAIRVVKKY